MLTVAVIPAAEMAEPPIVTVIPAAATADSPVVAVIPAEATAEPPVAGNPAAAMAEPPVAGNPAAATTERPMSGNPAAATAEHPGNRVCYHCREKGHIKRNCPEIGNPEIRDPSTGKNSNQVTLLRFKSFPVLFYRPDLMISSQRRHHRRPITVFVGAKLCSRSGEGCNSRMITRILFKQA
jgi:hypothetical protein